MRIAVATCLWLAATLPVLAQPVETKPAEDGCDVDTSSYVRLTPPARSKGPVVAMPQTPCPTIGRRPDMSLEEALILRQLLEPRERPEPDRSGPAVDDLPRAGSRGR